MVWLSADKYMLTGLKHHALQKFLNQATKILSDGTHIRALGQALTLIFDNTTHTNIELRLAATLFCIQNYQRVEENNDLVQIISQNEPIAWMICRSALKDFRFDLRAKSERLQSLYNELKDDTHKHLACRNCNTTFPLRVVEDTGYYAVSAGVRRHNIRCSYCSTVQ